VRQIELTLDLGIPPPPFLFTPRYRCNYGARDDLLIGLLDRELCLGADKSPTGEDLCCTWVGLLPRLRRGLDLTEPGETLVNVILPLVGVADAINDLAEDKAVFSHVAISRVHFASGSPGD
jgi:hypothetical protein